MSGAFAQAGIKAVVLSSGGVKGAGVTGTEITEEQKAHWQALVDSVQGEFVAAVAGGRRMSATKVKALADGRSLGIVETEERGHGAGADGRRSLHGLASDTQEASRIGEAEGASGGERRILAERMARDENGIA